MGLQQMEEPVTGEDDHHRQVNGEVLNRLNSLDIERLSTQEKHNFVMSVSNNDVIVAFQAEPICDMALIITILIVLLLLVWGFSFKWFYS